MSTVARPIVLLAVLLVPSTKLLAQEQNDPEIHSAPKTANEPIRHTVQEEITTKVTICQERMVCCAERYGLFGDKIRYVWRRISVPVEKEVAKTAYKEIQIPSVAGRPGAVGREKILELMDVPRTVGVISDRVALAMQRGFPKSDGFNWRPSQSKNVVDFRTQSPQDKKLIQLRVDIDKTNPQKAVLRVWVVDVESPDRAGPAADLIIDRFYKSIATK